MGEFSTLESVCAEFVDCVNRTAPESYGGEYYAVGTPAMRGNVINLTEARRLSAETFERWTRRLRPIEGDLLIAREAPVGPVVRIPAGDCYAAGQRTTHLRADSAAIDPRYLYYLLISPNVQARLLAQAMGSTVPHLRVADLRTFELPVLPEMSQQSAIAEVLGALDDKISANERAAAKSRELANARFAGSAAHGITVRVSDVVEILTRGVTPKYVDGDGMVVLNQKCVRGQSVSLVPARCMVPLTSRLDRLLRRDDVLVNSTGVGTLGRAARWTRQAEATVDSHITIVRFDDRLVDPVCAGFALLKLEAQIEALAEGSTGQTELRRELLARLDLRVPSRAAQVALGADLNQLDSLELGLADESLRLVQTRDELLPLLMSGKLCVKDAESVVSEVL
ncbi:restriction endonuclease subunit S [Mycobacteroides abscessus]|uniref:restriction endonuclease subunit S n=1 Tax=Mycobacteroides abscessus TaxID=36809 RepID=UPI0034CEB5F9